MLVRCIRNNDVKRYKSKDGKPLLSSNVVDIATYKSHKARKVLYYI